MIEGSKIERTNENGQNYMKLPFYYANTKFLRLKKKKSEKLNKRVGGTEPPLPSPPFKERERERESENERERERETEKDTKNQIGVSFSSLF